MQFLRRALLAVFAVLATALPAAAQSMAGSVNPGNFIYVWIVILVVGIVVFVAFTSMAVSGKK